jgi:hypothetical protein
MKTNKHQTLPLVRNQRAVHSRDLVQHFRYSPGTARSYLSYLGRQGLLERIGASYGLTEKGQDRLHFFDVSSCADAACPLCQGKNGYLTCPSFGCADQHKRRVGLDSRPFGRARLELPSQEFGFDLARSAIARGAGLVIMRGRKLWLKRILR